MTTIHPGINYANGIEIGRGGPVLVAGAGVPTAAHPTGSISLNTTGANVFVSAGNGNWQSLISSGCGVSINGIGDSITAQAIYQPANQFFPNVPAWQPSTAYTVGQQVTNGTSGFPYNCTTAGTSASSGGPSGTTLSQTDGTVVWAPSFNSANKEGTSFLTWAEIWSNGKLNFDMTQGYGSLAKSLLKLVISNGGSNYTAPTITLNQGATATLQVASGVITGYTITNPGYGSSGFTATISDSTGSGAVIYPVQGGSGTFGVYGCTTGSMVARLSDVLASRASIITVHGGTNDLTNSGTYSSITANLQTCYETLMAAGRWVIAIPITPRTGLTTAMTITLMRVNAWIRAYCAQEAWANPNRFQNIVLADPTVYLTDNSNALNYPLGGSSNTSPNVTFDGLHPSQRGAAIIGYCVWLAAQTIVGPAFPVPSRTYSSFDGADATINPRGNMLEALPWGATTGYTVGQLRSANSNIYECTTAGTSASTAPSGTGNPSDGTVVWHYLHPMGISVAQSGTGGTQTAATGITYSGTFQAGVTISRTSGTASGTVTGSIESTRTDGLPGQRPVIAWSLGSGSTTETWTLIYANSSYPWIGILAADLGVTSVYVEMDVEISGMANMTQLYAYFKDSSLAWDCYSGPSGSGAGSHLIPPSGDVFAWPTTDRVVLRSCPFILPSNMANFLLELVVGFDASGSAGSATATIKINHVAVRRALTA